MPGCDLEGDDVALGVILAYAQRVWSWWMRTAASLRSLMGIPIVLVMVSDSSSRGVKKRYLLLIYRRVLSIMHSRDRRGYRGVAVAVVRKAIALARVLA